MTIRAFAEAMAKVIGWSGEFVYDRAKPDGTPRKLVDTTRINALGWRAKIGLEDGLRDAYAWFESYPRTHGMKALTPFSEQFDYDSPLNKFISGKVSMMLQGPWLANIIEAHRPDLDYYACPFPVADGLLDNSRPVGMIDTDVLVIPRGAKDPEASMEFIAYTQRQEIVEYLSKIHCKMSTLRESTEEFLSTHKNRAVRVHDALAKSDRAFYSPKTRAWPELRVEYGYFAQGLWNGDLTLDQGLTRLQQRTQQTLDVTADQQRRRDAINRRRSRGGAS
jgi:ABC-type glycerol-3-phosphate transport system substrate-binding protein